MNLTLRKIGNSVGVILPKAVLDDLGLKEGDTVDLEPKDGGLMLRPSDEDFARQIEIGRQFMEKYKVALKKLAE